MLESWQNLGFPLQVIEPVPLTFDDFCLAHDPEYVRGVLDCTISNGFGTRSEQVAASLPWTNGSMVSAALDALQNGGAVASLSSGFHHSGHAFGGGFCSYNGLMIAAIKAKQAGAGRVGILDLDQHAGNGTKDIIEKLGIEYVDHWSLGYSDVWEGEKAAAHLVELPTMMRDLFGECDLLLYQAGGDSCIEDPLGGVYTVEQMRERDGIVFETCREMGLPVAICLGGGYASPFRKVLDLHDQTAVEWNRVYGGEDKVNSDEIGPEDFDLEFQENYLKMARETFKETNPKLAAILEKYAKGK